MVIVPGRSSDKLKVFLEKYFGIGNRTFEADPQEEPKEHQVVRYDFSIKETPMMNGCRESCSVWGKENDDK